MFAGVNANPGEGLLTALEVGDLDLGRAELVVLSACHTGQGKAGGSEGVLGLQRALQVSGAGPAVVSLWSVDDKATQRLMSDFYLALWDQGMAKSEALRAAQLAMIRGDLSDAIYRWWPLAEEQLSPLVAAAEVAPAESGDPKCQRITDTRFTGRRSSFPVTGDNSQLADMGSGQFVADYVTVTLADPGYATSTH